jgi:hypothetical protein
VSAYWQRVGADAYEQRATQHRPTDAEKLGREVRRLVAGGLTPRDIAGALQVHVAEVLRLLVSTDAGHSR